MSGNQQSLTGIEQFVRDNPDVSFSEQQQEAIREAERDTTQTQTSDVNGGGGMDLPVDVSDAPQGARQQARELVGGGPSDSQQQQTSGDGGSQQGSQQTPAQTPQQQAQGIVDDITPGPTPPAPEPAPDPEPTPTQQQPTPRPSPTPEPEPQPPSDGQQTPTGQQQGQQPTQSQQPPQSTDTPPEQPLSGNQESGQQQGANIPVPSSDQAGIVGRFESDIGQSRVGEIQQGLGSDRQLFTVDQGSETLAVSAESRDAVQDLLGANVETNIANRTPFSEEGVRVTDDGVQLTEQGEQTQRQLQREQFAESATEQIPGTFQADDVVLGQEGPTLDLQAQREAIATREGVPTEDVTLTPDGFNLDRPEGVQAAPLISGTTPEQRAVIEANAPPEQQGQDIQLDPSAIDPRGPEMPDNVGLSQDIQQNQQVTATPDFSVPSAEESQQVREAQQARTQNLRQQFPTVYQDIEQSLEEDTGAELSAEDIVLTRDGQQISGRLSEQGQESVEVQNTPGGDLPLIGPVLEEGTRTRQDIREVTEGPRQAFQSAVPEADSVTGLLGAAAPVAAAEPTPFGEIGLAGATITAGALIGASTLSEDVVGQDPTARTSELVPSGSIVDQSELQPSETTQDQTELTPTGTTVDQTELDVSGDIQTPEASVPTGSVFGPELSVSETTEGTQTGEPTGETVVPSDFPLPGRDTPADPRRDFVQRETPESVLSTSPLLEQPQQQERGQQRQRERITGDDIPSTIEEPDQPGPSVRERQRREDLFAPERGFFTGEEAVIGREASETTRETQQRLTEAETPFSVTDGVFGPSGPLLAGTRERQQQAQTPQTFTQTQPELDQDIAPLQSPFQTPEVNARTEARPLVDVQATQAQQLDLLQLQRPVTEQQAVEPQTATENPNVNPTENVFANPTAPAFATGPAFGPAAPSEFTPGGEIVDDNDDDPDPFLTPTGEELENPVASGAQFLFGGFGGESRQADNAGGLFSGQMDNQRDEDSGSPAGGLFGGFL